MKVPKSGVIEAPGRLRGGFLLVALALTCATTALAAGTSDELSVGRAAHLQLAPGETRELNLVATAGTTYTLDLVAAEHAVVWVSDPDGRAVGRFMSAYGLTFVAGEDGRHTLSVSAEGKGPLGLSSCLCIGLGHG